MTDTTQTAARRYTLAEVDALRRAITRRLLAPADVCWVEPPRPDHVEAQVRTAMMAGITAEEYEAERREEGDD